MFFLGDNRCFNRDVILTFNIQWDYFVVCNWQYDIRVYIFLEDNHFVGTWEHHGVHN